MSRDHHDGPLPALPPAARPGAHASAADLIPSTPGGTPAPGVAPAERRAATPPAGLDAVALLKALKRRWRMALGLGVLATAVIAPAAWFLIPPSKYTAISLLQVESEPTRLIFPTQETQTQYSIFQKTQTALITSRFVLNSALKDPAVVGLKEIREQVDPAGWLSDELSVKFVPGSEILQISMSGDKPENLARIVNAVVQAYMREVVSEAEDVRHARYALLQDLWKKYQGELRVARKNLREVVERLGANDKETSTLAQQYIREHLAQAQSNLQTIRNSIQQAEIRQSVLQVRTSGSAAPSIPAALVEQEVEADPQVEWFKNAIADLQRNVDKGSRVARNPMMEPTVKEPRKKIAELEGKLTALRSQLRKQIRARLEASTRQTQGSELAEVKEELRVLGEIRATLEKDVESLASQATSASRDSMDLQDMQDKIGLQQEAADRVGKEVEALQVELKAPARIRLVEPADPPRVKDEMRKYKMTGMAALGAFAMALCGVSFLEYRRHRIDAADEVVQLLGMRLMGALPTLPSGGRGRPALGGPRDRNWEGLLVESIDATRTMLLHASRAESIRVVMVTSAVKGEGKTSTSGHLATSLARGGRRTLLVDCDLRNPAVHRLFDLTPEAGVCDLLRGDTDVVGKIWSTGAPFLDVLPAGQVDVTALRALARDGLRGLFEGLKEDYDFIIVDTSPVLPVADAMLVGQSVDAVLFSIMREVSQLPKVRSAYERLTFLGARILGAVVTGAAPPEDLRGYGASYYRAVPAGHGDVEE